MAMPRFSDTRLLLSLLVCMLVASPLVAQWLPLNPVKTAELQPDGALLILEGGFFRFRFCSASIVRFFYPLDRTPPQHPDFPVIKNSWPKPEFSLQTDNPKSLFLTTPKL